MQRPLPHILQQDLAQALLKGGSALGDEPNTWSTESQSRCSSVPLPPSGRVKAHNAHGPRLRELATRAEAVDPV